MGNMETKKKGREVIWSGVKEGANAKEKVEFII